MIHMWTVEVYARFESLARTYNAAEFESDVNLKCNRKWKFIVAGNFKFIARLDTLQTFDMLARSDNEGQER